MGRCPAPRRRHRPRDSSGIGRLRQREDSGGKESHASRRNKKGSLHPARRCGARLVGMRGPRVRAGRDSPRCVRPARRIDVRGREPDVGRIAHRSEPRHGQDVEDDEEPRLPRRRRSDLLEDLAYRAGTLQDAERGLGGHRAGRALQERGPRRDVVHREEPRRSTVPREVGAGLRGGMGLHSIAIDATDPKKMQVGISVGGVYRTEDGGVTWVQDNKVNGAPSERPDVFYCIHKLLAHPEESGLRFMRVHEEVYWRDPGETTWQFSTKGLPTNFGFAAAMHPRDRSTAYVIPLDGMKRTASPFGIGVYRTTDKGKTWDRLDKGLPEGAPMESVREGMHNDRLDPMGLYFGTANGDVWASKNEGESWSRV